MATLISGQVVYDDNNQPSGIAITWRLKHQEYPLFLSQEDVEGLGTQEIIDLAQTRADALAANHIPGNPYLFNRRYEGIADLDNLPNWATWTGGEAAAFIEDAILNGRTKQQARDDIDALFAGVTNLATLGAATVQALKLISDAVIDERDLVLQNAGRAVMYLRDISIR